MHVNVVCVLLFVLTVSLAQEAPHLTVLPTGSVIRRDLGTTGFFTCRVSQQHEQLVDDVVWLDPRGQEVPDERQNRLYSSDASSGKGRELFVSNITENDSGNYTCKARYGTNQEITKTFALLVYMSIRWEDAPQRQNPVMGSRALIRCVARASPPAIVEWFRGSQLISGGGRYTTQDDGLVIENITSEDDGVYLCRAKVPAEGELDERRITVEVHSRPEITEPKPGTVVEVVEDEAGSIRCLASGKPTPTRSWLAPDGADADLTDGLTVDRRDGTLTFQPARRQMAGRYRCLAANHVDTVETSVEVVVIVKPEVVRYENVTSSEGESAVLECRADGSPLPAVSFRRVGSDMRYEEAQFSGDDRATVQQREEGGLKVGVLTIRDLTRDDDGLYECVATNQGGHQATAPGLLTVQYSPRLSGPPEREVFTWAGRAANLSCSAQAVPNATVRWRPAGGRPVDDPQLEQIGDGPESVLRVTPTDASFYGVYTCTASNPLGSDSLDITLHEATAPGPLSNVVFEEVTATSVEFALVPPASNGGLPVTSYAVEHVQRGQPWEVAQRREWPAEQHFLLEDLTPQQTYQFRFAAKNEVGLGPWSAEAERMMPNIAAPQPPEILMAEEMASPPGDGTDHVVLSERPDSYELHWHAGADNGAKIDNYQVSYYKVINNKNIWRVVSEKLTSVVDAPGPLSFRLTNLKPESYYRVELRAHNHIGFGDPAQLIVFTAPGGAQAAAPPPSLASSLVIGVVAAVLLVLLVLIDLTCYAVNNRGITHMLCSKARGTSGSAKLNEEAASEKEPLQENGNGTKNTPESNGERDVPEVTIDKAQLEAAKDSAV